MSSLLLKRESVSSSDPEKVLTVLAISSSKEDRSALQNILGHSKWAVIWAADCNQALPVLQSRSASVVVCDHKLPDGTWMDIQNAASGMDGAPPVIVSSLQADDRLWAEVLNMGGYDVLAKPFETTEVVRILSLAWLHWKDLRRKRATSLQALAAAAAS